MKTEWIRQTTAAAGVVVFLLCFVLTAGCQNVQDDASSAQSSRPARRKAGEYSRIPANYPSSWQTATGGN